MKDKNLLRSGHVVRYSDLDWIKVLTMLIVFLYHISMFFNSFPWHVKNNVINESYIQVFSLLVGNWIMPLFFIISGISTFHALQKRNAPAFLKERFLRLGFPLLLGVFVLSPPQVYVERMSNKQFEGTFYEFFPHYFDGLYLEIGGTGNFAFFGHHLWYLLMLLLFSCLTLPFFQRGRKDISTKSFSSVHFLLLPILLIVVAMLFNEIVNLASWGIFFYLILYIYGYYFFARESIRGFFQRTGRYTGSISAMSTIGYVFWVFATGFPTSGTLESLLFMLLRVIMVWNTLFFIFYLGNKYLNFSNGVLKYTSDAAMPFYVLHQPVIVLSGFLIYNYDWSVSTKLMFLIPISLTIIMGLYHCLIRRINLLRVLMGLRKTNKPKLIQDSQGKMGI